MKKRQKTRKGVHEHSRYSSINSDDLSPSSGALHLPHLVLINRDPPPAAADRARRGKPSTSKWVSRSERFVWGSGLLTCFFGARRVSQPSGKMAQRCYITGEERKSSVF